MSRPISFIIQSRVLTPTAVLEDGMVVVQNGRITAVGPASQISPPPDLPLWQFPQMTLVPGLIDLQFNGAFGLDFTQNPASIWSVAARLPQYGVTSFLPTIITSPLATVAQAQQVMTQRPSPFLGAEPLGLHLEGPFLNPRKKGAHNPAYMQLPTIEAVADWSPQTHVRLVTLAPEMPGALTAVRHLSERGVLVSAGHSMANWQQAQAGFEAGIRYGTHLFNAMPPLHHRDPGLVAALLDDGRVTVGLIADGFHVHPKLVKFAWQLAADRINLVTDGMAALGMPPGQYILGDYHVQVDEEGARLLDGTLAGCVVPMDTAVRQLMAYTGCSLAQAVASASQIPADRLGLGQQKGRLAAGYDADLLLLTADHHVAMTFVGGQLAYHNQTIPALAGV